MTLIVVLDPHHFVLSAILLSLANEIVWFKFCE